MRCHAIFPSHPYENQNRDIGVNHSIAHAVANFIVLYWVHKNDELRIYTCIISFFPCGQSSALLRVKKITYSSARERIGAGSFVTFSFWRGIHFHRYEKCCLMGCVYACGGF